VVAAPCRAAPGKTALVWLREPHADTCLSAAEARERLEEWLGADALVSRDEATLLVEARLMREEAAGPWKARVSVSSAEGRVLGIRELVDPLPDCRRLGERVILVVALMMDPDALSKLLGSDGGPRPEEPKGLASRRSWSLAAGAGVSLSVGLLPDVSPGLSVRMTATRPHLLSVELRATAWAPSRAYASTGGSDVSLATVGLAVCPHLWTGGNQRFEACGGADVGRFQAQGFGFDSNAESVKTTVGASAAVQWVFQPAPHLSFNAGLQGWVAVVRPQFVYQDALGLTQPVFQQWPVAIATDIGASFDFGS
jgi:hypothetical protein